MINNIKHKISNPRLWLYIIEYFAWTLILVFVDQFSHAIWILTVLLSVFSWLSKIGKDSPNVWRRQNIFLASLFSSFIIILYQPEFLY